MISVGCKNINAAWQYKGTVQSSLKSKLLDQIFIQLPVASEVVMNARVQLAVRKQVKEHMQAYVMALFHE